MSTTNTTHRKTLARALMAVTGESYAAARARITKASDAGLLPTRLDDDGIAEAVRILTAAPSQVAAAPSDQSVHVEDFDPAPTTSPTGVSTVDDPADPDPADAPVRRTASDPRDQPILDLSYEFEVATGNQGLMYISAPGGKDRYVFGTAPDGYSGTHTALGRDEAHRHIAGLVEQARAAARAQQDTSTSSTTSPAASPATDKPATTLIPRVAHTETRCTASSWRDNPGRHGEKVYGPGGFNRCVRKDGHTTFDHLDEWGNRFRLEPTFRVLGHAETAEVTQAAAAAGTLAEGTDRHYLVPAVLGLLRQVWQGRVAYQRGPGARWVFTVDDKPASDINDLHLRWLVDNGYIDTADLTPGDEWAVARTTDYGDEVLAANGADVDRFHDGLPGQKKTRK